MSIRRMASEQGQALTEFAIIGAMALVALGFLIQILLRVNYQLEIDSATFRRAQWVAQDEGEEESQAVSIIHMRDRQMPDPSQTFAMTNRLGTQASATVTWGEWLTYLADDRDSQARSIVRLNNSTREFRSEDMVGETPGGSPCDPSEDDDCEPLPLIGHIHKDVTATGQVWQNQTNSGLSTDASETTIMTFNTDDNDTMMSTTNTSVSVNW